ncbi:hypothetical protein G6F68_017453 [Rhizopus microsporus]|nr:hypothetical protein G6F68_017453 [Rhizopus microsporus]
MAGCEPSTGIRMRFIVVSLLCASRGRRWLLLYSNYSPVLPARSCAGSTRPPVASAGSAPALGRGRRRQRRAQQAAGQRRQRGGAAGGLQPQFARASLAQQAAFLQLVPQPARHGGTGFQQGNAGAGGRLDRVAQEREMGAAQHQHIGASCAQFCDRGAHGSLNPRA